MKTVDSRGREKVTPGFPVGTVTPFYGYAVPTDWALCDGTAGTPDLRDRFIVGDSVVGLGTASGTQSPTAVITHVNMAASDHPAHSVTAECAAHPAHSVTAEATAHPAHTITQANPHSDHSTDGVHTHDAHNTDTSTVGITANITGPVTHASTGTGHTHGAHAVHTGQTIDAGAAHPAHSSTIDSGSAHSSHTGTTIDAGAAHSAHSVTQQSDHAALKTYLLIYIKKIA